MAFDVSFILLPNTCSKESGAGRLGPPRLISAFLDVLRRLAVAELQL
jgi:hypothetical protein